MEKDLNPAQRLHAFLLIFGETRRRHPDDSLLDVWDGVLDSRGNDELPALDVAKLVALVIDVRDTAQFLDRMERPHSLRVVEEHAEEWLRPMYFTAVTDFEHLDESEGISVSDESLAALESLGEIFQDNTVVADKLSDDQVADLLAQFEELAKNVRKATDLPDELRRRVLSVLYAILQALNDIRIRGPQGVVVALDSLAATLTRLGGHRETKWWGNALSVVVHAYAALGVVVTTHDGAQILTDGADVIRQITAGG